MLKHIWGPYIAFSRLYNRWTLFGLDTPRSGVAAVPCLQCGMRCIPGLYKQPACSSGIPWQATAAEGLVRAINKGRPHDMSGRGLAWG